LSLGYQQWYSGENERAQQLMQQAFVTQSDFEMGVLRLVGDCNRASLFIFAGLLHEAAATLERVLEVTNEQTDLYRIPAAIAHINIGLIYYAWNHLERAVRHVAQGLDMGQPWIYFNSLLSGYFILAQIEQARHHFAASDRALKTVEHFVRVGQITPLEYLLDAQRARLNLHRGNLAFARRWALRSGIREPLEAI
jgi:ATP/maltotriose-dependent transcriptional regulator MalT